MFRIAKKRSKPKAIRLTADAEDEDDGGPAVTLASKKKTLKKSNRTVIVDDGGKKKRKRNGMGFGGTRPSAMDIEMDVDPAEASNFIQAQVDREQPATSSVSYGKEALLKLKSEQKLKVSETNKETKEATVPREKANATTTRDALPSYIPLNGKSLVEEPTILTGEEALQFEQRRGSAMMEEEILDEVEEKSQSYSNEAEESSAWEAEVTRRAGISQSFKRGAPTTGPRLSSSQGPGKVSLLHLKSQIGSALSSLQDQRDDLERARQRRETEVIQTRSVLQRQQAEVKQSGNSLEYYQQLRETLASWIGALRELSSKLKPIQVALHDLESEVAANSHWREWENDTISVLHQAGLLDTVVGRQPPSTAFDDIAMVDDFGRDIKSQHSMQREKRSRHRKRIREQREEPIRGDESDAVLSDGEQEVFRERHMSLQKALDVAMNDLDDEYTKLQNIVTVFEEWRLANAEEYRQCFASLSLGDLASVLIQADLCHLHDPWNESDGYKEAKWIAIAHGATNTLGFAGLARIMEKAVFPAVSDLLDRSGYNLASSKQTRSLTTFYRHVQKLFPEDSDMLQKLRGRVSAYLQEQLQEIAIPILRRPMVLPATEPTDLIAALATATTGQMHRIRKIVGNVLMHWSIILPADDVFIGTVLDFLSTRFLFLLSSLQGLEQPQFAATPTDVFGEVWSLLQGTRWLDRPEWMIQAAPLRAAAIAYNIN
jgi:hypothetical protein